MRKIIIIICLGLLLGGCRSTPSRDVNNAFYYWKSVFELTQQDVELLDSLQVRTLYIKFFDVDWQSDLGDAFPVAVVQFKTPVPEGIEIVPTVFITNATLKNLPETSIEQLADNITSKIERMLTPLGEVNVKEIQIDCDWTGSTRVKYFTLLKHITLKVKTRSANFSLQRSANLNLQEDITISATLRLHQIKYHKKTGIPPVSRGMLMFYNMGSPTQIDMQNSILDLDVAKQYIGNLETYPLPLDVVLPIFSWGVLFHHQQFIMLINNVRNQDLLDHKDFEHVKENIFQAKKNTYLNSQYIYKGDLIRVEEVSTAECEEGAKILASKIQGKILNVSLFHYDPNIVQHYKKKDLEDIYSAF